MREEAVSLGDTTWTMVELDDADVADEGAPQLVFDLEESRVAGSGDVNRLMGTFSLAEGELRFGPLATTMMAVGTMQRERQLLDALCGVTSHEHDGRSLTLLADDKIVARLAC